MIKSVPLTYYFTFWLINSLMSIGLGIILGYFGGFVLELTLVWRGSPETACFGGSLLAFILTQIAVVRNFFGGRRGHFEYAYKKRINSKEGNGLISREIGMISFPQLFWEELNDFSDYREDVYKRLLTAAEARKDDSLKFHVYMRLSRSSMRHFNFKKGKEWLQMALALRPHDLVANFQMASTLEKERDGEGAIARYESILKLCEIETIELREFIMEQITRVKKNGPAERPPIVGLRYMQF